MKALYAGSDLHGNNNFVGKDAELIKDVLKPMRLCYASSLLKGGYVYLTNSASYVMPNDDTNGHHFRRSLLRFIEKIRTRPRLYN